jgi:hypothetical protein
MSGRRVQVRDDLDGRGDVDLAVELQHGVATVLVDTQMPGGRCRILLHYDIASNRLLRWRDPRMRAQVTSPPCKLPSME